MMANVLKRSTVPSLAQSYPIDSLILCHNATCK